MDAVGREQEGCVGGQQRAGAQLVSDLLEVAVFAGPAVELALVGDAARDAGGDDDRHAGDGGAVCGVVPPAS